MSIVFSSFKFFPYWGLYLAPFLAIILVANIEETNHNFLLETISMATLTLAHYSVYSLCYDAQNAKVMILNKLFKKLNYEELPIKLGMVTKILKIYGYSEYVFAIYLLCLWAILWINRPEKICIKDQSTNYRRLMMQRLVVNAIIVSIPFGVVFLNILAL